MLSVSKCFKFDNKKHLSVLSPCFDYPDIITPTYYVIYRLIFVSLFCIFNLGINTV